MHSPTVCFLRPISKDYVVSAKAELAASSELPRTAARMHGSTDEPTAFRT